MAESHVDVPTEDQSAEVPAVQLLNGDFVLMEGDVIVGTEAIFADGIYVDRADEQHIIAYVPDVQQQQCVPVTDATVAAVDLFPADGHEDPPGDPVVVASDQSCGPTTAELEDEEEPGESQVVPDSCVATEHQGFVALESLHEATNTSGQASDVAGVSMQMVPTGDRSQTADAITAEYFKVESDDAADPVGGMLRLTGQSECYDHTYDMSANRALHEIEVSDWTGQSLVAMTPDGTTIPLAVLHQGPDGEITCRAEELAHFLQQLAMPFDDDGCAREQECLQSAPMILEADDGGAAHHVVTADDVQAAPDPGAPAMSARRGRRPSSASRAPQKRRGRRPKADTTLVIAPQPEGDEEDHVVELSNTTPSAISSENMEALIQILQSLPASARSQTIHIVLQPQEVKKTKPFVHTYDPPPVGGRDKQTSDIAIQVSPEFIDDALTEEGKDETTEAAAAVATVEEEEQNLHQVIMAALIDAPQPPQTGRRHNRKGSSSKQIVTVREHLVVDPKPGVSYYAVVDYLSEHEPDGYCSASSEMRRPQAPSSAFMEDHVELQETSEERGHHRSFLESTVDSSVVVSPFRRPRARSSISVTVGSIDLPPADEQATAVEEDLPEEEEEEEEGGPVARRRKRKRRRKNRRPREQLLEHKCGYCHFDSRERIQVVEHCLKEHDTLPVKTLSLLPRTSGRTCPYCQQVFDHLEFFTHMRRAHSEVHPYKCGYCEFMGRDRNQVRHHIQKKHQLPMKVINLLDAGRATTTRPGRKRIMAAGPVSDADDTVYEYLTDEEELEDDDDPDPASARRGLVCPECCKTFKTLKYLKTHIKVHQAHRYQCGYCDFISILLHQVLRHCQKKHSDVEPKILTKELEADKNPIVSRDIDDVVKKVFSLNTRLPRDPDASKWMRKWFCPHCDYTCQFGASYRRHLRMHANILPYKCNYCSFKGREKYYVRRHIHRMHPELPIIVVENTPENCAGDTSSDEDFQEKGLRRKRRRRAKDALHAVVPVEEVDDPDDFRQHFQMQPIREHMRLRVARTEDLQNVPPSRPRTSADGQKALHRHARKHPVRVKPFKCSYCNYMAVERGKIQAHHTLKHNNLPVKMEECHLTSLAPQDFMDLIGGAPTPPQPQFACPLCQEQVSYEEQELSEHFFAHFEYHPYRCSECDHHDVSESLVAEHCAAVHADVICAVLLTDQVKPDGLDDTISQFVQEGRAPTETAAETPYACPVCKQQIGAHAANVRRHLYGHFDYTPFRCGHCGFRDVTKVSVEQHSATTHADVQARTEATEDAMPPELARMLQAAASYIWRQSVGEGRCPWCGHLARGGDDRLRHHLLGHVSLRPFRCGHCQVEFVRRTDATHHVVHEHPGLALRLDDDVDEDAVRKSLARFIDEATEDTAMVTADLLQEALDVLKPTRPMFACGYCAFCSEDQAATHTHLKDNHADKPALIKRSSAESSGVATAPREDDGPSLHALTPLAPAADDQSFEALDQLEECDENLPRILQILQLRPTKDDD